MENFNQLSNKTICEEIGRRLQTERLNQNITQAALAEQAGIARRTLVGAERGERISVDTLLSVLRALDCLQQIDLFLPNPEISPVQLSKLKGKQRQRASKKCTYTPVRKAPWAWNET